MKLIKLIQKTAGGRHGWFETRDGYRVRKPLAFADKLGAADEISPDTINVPPEAIMPQEPQNNANGAIVATPPKTISWARRIWYFLTGQWKRLKNP